MRGASRKQLEKCYKLQSASFRFIPIAETTIEQKHAVPSHANKVHHIGPTRFSPSDRIPWMEKQLKRGHMNVKDLLQAFSSARSLEKCPALLGIENHPRMLESRKQKPSQLRAGLAQVIYRCEPRSMFQNLKKAAKANATSKRNRLLWMTLSAMSPNAERLLLLRMSRGPSGLCGHSLPTQIKLYV